MNPPKVVRIGLSACFFHADPLRPTFKGKTLQYLEQSMAHWILSEANVILYLIPNPEEGSSTTLKDYVHDLDGLVLQGGSDVCPKSYGETALKPEWNGDFIRDQYEIALVKEFVAQHKPVLGICRGIQLINVAFGGTLYQDIQTQITDSKVHRDWEIYDQNFHTLTLEQGSGLQKLYPEAKSPKVNSVHHQALKDLGQGLVVEAKSIPDGLIEAVRLQSKDYVFDYVFAVQWHPEFQDPKDKTLMSGGPILREFLEQVRNRKVLC